jgi:hypothetical protein
MAGNPDYPNRGTLWTSKNKKTEKSPDMYGSIAIEREYLMQLIREQDGDPLVEVKIDGWRERDKDGNPKVAMKVNTWKPDGQQAPKPQSDEKDPWDD